MHLRRRPVLAVLLIILLVVLFQLREDRLPSPERGGSYLDRGLVFVYTPIQKTMDKLTGFVSDTWSRYINLVGVKRENKRLREQLELQDLYILSLKERLKIHDRENLTKQKVQRRGWEGIPARVIAFDPYARSHTLWISAGSEQGVELDLPVITLEGLVGRVVKVFDQSSQVLLLVDSRFSVDVIDESTRVRALVVGSGRGAEVKRYPYLTHLEFLKLGDAIREGDLLITSGFSDLYPKGIPVGNVIRIQKDEGDLFQTSLVLPVVDFTKLDQAMVLTGKVK